MNETPRYSVCIPAGGKWLELSAHWYEDAGREALSVQLVTDSDAALWDWESNTVVPSSTRGTE